MGLLSIGNAPITWIRLATRKKGRSGLSTEHCTKLHLPAGDGSQTRKGKSGVHRRLIVFLNAPDERRVGCCSSPRAI